MAELSFLGTQTLKQGFIGGASIVYTKKEYHYMKWNHVAMLLLLTNMIFSYLFIYKHKYQKKALTTNWNTIKLK